MAQREEYSAAPLVFASSTIVEGDARRALEKMPSGFFQCVITSPPYWSLRDYSIRGQIGLEATVDEYIGHLVGVFAQVRRVLRDDGILWLNIGDSYTSGGRTWRAPDRKNQARAMQVRPNTPIGLKPKDLIGVPWRLAFALQSDGWFLRSDIVWEKPNAMPESVKDRPTKCHEYLFLLTKSEKYYYDHRAIQDDNGRNRRTVWHINTQPYPEAHFATFPEALVEPCVQAGSKVGDFILDPFFGTGTVGVVCDKSGRNYVGIDLSPEYVAMAHRRLTSLVNPVPIVKVTNDG